MPVFWPRLAGIMIAIDTNVVVRYLAGDHAEQSGRARLIVDGHSVFVPVTVILETEWVLRSAYGYSRSDVVRALRAFGGLPTVTVEDDQLVAVALDLSETGMDFADALHFCRSRHCEGFVTFDQRLVKAAASVGNGFVREA